MSPSEDPVDEDAAAHGQGWEPSAPEIAEMRSFLEREHRAHQRGREAVYDRAVEERVAAGTAIDGVFFSGAEADGNQKLLVFTCRRNDSRFRPGTRLRLSRGDPRRAAGRLELVDDRYDGKKYVLRLSGTVENPEVLDDGEPWILDEDVFDLLDAQLGLLREAEERGLAAWLSGAEERPSPSGPVPSLFSRGLGGSMAEAFDAALRTPRWFAIQGPPGSGKTHLLAKLALHYALEEGKRVLVTAVSHQAIHQALGETYYVCRRSASEPEAGEAHRVLLREGFLKLGASRGANEGLPAGVRPAFRTPRPGRPFVAGATIYAAMNLASQANGRVLFDVVLFDEAGQAPMILALGARLLAKDAVFIGDDAQLPPIVELADDEEAGPLSRHSALSFIRETYADPALLRETHRLNAELAAVVSDCFYDGALAPTPEAAPRTLALAARPSPAFAKILDPGAALVFVDVPHEECRSLSEPEAARAAVIVAEAIRCGVRPEEIGVIAPYRAQCNRIRFLMGRRAVTASTVERFQGQERELVVISLTSSSLRYLARLAAFLFSPNRLNVAISRARTKVILLGARKALCAAAEAADEEGTETPAAAGLRVFRRIMERASAADGAGLPSSVPAAPTPPEPDGGAVFEPGDAVDHALHGPGRVLAKSVQLIDNRREWINEVRFADGVVRIVIPRLSDPPMRLID